MYLQPLVGGHHDRKAKRQMRYQTRTFASHNHESKRLRREIQVEYATCAVSNAMDLGLTSQG